MVLQMEATKCTTILAKERGSIKTQNARVHRETLYDFLLDNIASPLTNISLIKIISQRIIFPKNVMKMEIVEVEEETL